MQYIERHIDSLDWVILLLVGCLVLLVIVKQLYPKRFHEFVLLPATNKYFLVQGRDEELQHPFNLILFVVQAVSVSLFIYLFQFHFNPEIVNSSPKLFIQICTGFVVFVLIKFVFEKIIGNIFSIDSLINNYLYQKLSYRNLLSVLFLIGNLIFFFVVKPTVTMLFIFALAIVLLNCLTLLYCFKTKARDILGNFFYFILYLCALEISPYIILYQALV